MACASYLCQSIIHRLCRFNLISMGNKEIIIHPTAIIYDNVIIEDGVVIGPYCVIGAEPEWKGKEGEGKGVYIMSGTVARSGCSPGTAGASDAAQRLGLRW